MMKFREDECDDDKNTSLCRHFINWLITVISLKLVNFHQTMTLGCIFSHERPFYERIVSDLDP
jgi:hypothetical protein